MPEEPRCCYTSRLEVRREAVARAEHTEQQLAHARLAAFVAGAALAWVVLATPALSAGWIALPVLGFGALIAAHDRARRRRIRALRAVHFYERGLARLDYRFAGQGRGGDAFASSEHPYADHLDLFGAGGLFELLSNAQTEAGVRTLADWLLRRASPDEIRARQQAVRELSPYVDLREDLAVLGPEAREGVDPEGLVRWGRAPAELASTLVRAMAAALAGATVLAAMAALALPGFGAVPLVALAAAEGAFALFFRTRTRRVAHDVESALQGLAHLLELISRLERERFQSPALVEIRSALQTEGVAAAREIGRLRRLSELLSQRQNQFFAPIAPFLLWTTQLGFAIEGWRARCGPRLPGWIQVIGRLEALCDLAGYAYEHPADPFPEIADQGTVFRGEGLGHPLLPESACVRNDLRLDPEHALYVVSGSNMSGKSTLLRTVGTNAVLALAGAPVRARRLEISPLAVGASIVLRDSLQDGESRFYSEIRRLRRIVDLCDGPPPGLFLLDEILGGTNSHDRGVGAAAVVRGLVERGAVGLLTTHDLALARIADDLAPRAANVHFEDQLTNGRMEFDYRLRDGIVTHSNAIALMRAVGLSV